MEGSDKLVLEIIPNKYLWSKWSLERLVEDDENERFVFTQNIYPIYESDLLTRYGYATDTMFSGLTRGAFILKLLKKQQM